MYILEVFEAWFNLRMKITLKHIIIIFTLIGKKRQFSIKWLFLSCFCLGGESGDGSGMVRKNVWGVFLLFGCTTIDILSCANKKLILLHALHIYARCFILLLNSMA